MLCFSSPEPKPKPRPNPHEPSPTVLRFRKLVDKDKTLLSRLVHAGHRSDEETKLHVAACAMTINKRAILVPQFTDALQSNMSGYDFKHFAESVLDSLEEQRAKEEERRKREGGSDRS